MIVVGLTGNMAAGKSAVAGLWRSLGVPVASADELSRRAVAPGSRALEAVSALLGPAVVGPDGELDRAAVRSAVFASDDLRRALEEIVHPEVRRLRDDWMAEQRQAGAGIVAWEVPLLFETGMENEVDVVVHVEAPADLRLERAVANRGLTEAEARAMMAAQQPSREKCARADFVIRNDGSRAELAARATATMARVAVAGRQKRSGGCAGRQSGDPDARGRRIDAILDLLLKASPVVVTSHANADGDAAGSSVALAAFLEAHGAEVRLANTTPFPASYDFLLPDAAWALEPKSAAESDWCRRAGAAVVVDTAEPARIGRIAGKIRGLPTVVIDHHPPAEAGSAEKAAPPDRNFPNAIALIDATAAAAGELVFEIIERAGGPWTETIVNALYVAILTDTGGLRFQNTTPRTLCTAARLVELGAEPERLSRMVWSNAHPRRYALLQEALGTLAVHPGGRVAWMTVPRDAFDRLGATGDDLEGFVDIPRDLAGVEIAILFRITSDQRIKVSLRAQPPAAVNGIARELGGGGHAQAAAAVVAGALQEVQDRVVTMAVAALGGVGR